MNFCENSIMISSGLSSERIILSPFTKEFRGEGHSYESLNFSEALFLRAVILKLFQKCIISGPNPIIS